MTKNRLPGDICEECRKPLAPGDHVTFTEDTFRFWHTQCFEDSLSPLPKLQGRIVQKQKSERINRE